jgi:hypothetical protein
VCLHELHPNEMRGFHGLKPLRTYLCASAPFPPPSAQAPTPFVSASPLLEWCAHLCPTCPLCGIRVSFAPSSAVWQQGLLVYPALLPLYGCPSLTPHTTHQGTLDAYSSTAVRYP